MDVKCPYRSMSGTGTGIYGVFSLVWVPSMDLYEHSALLGEGFPSTDREAEGGGGEAGGVHEVGAGVGLPGVADGLGGAERGAVQADQAA